MQGKILISNLLFFCIGHTCAFSENFCASMLATEGALGLAATLSRIYNEKEKGILKDQFWQSAGQRVIIVNRKQIELKYHIASGDCGNVYFSTEGLAVKTYFGGNPASEIEYLEKAKRAGIRTPHIFEVDHEQQVVIREYIRGLTYTDLAEILTKLDQGAPMQCDPTLLREMTQVLSLDLTKLAKNYRSLALFTSILLRISYLM